MSRAKLEIAIKSLEFAREYTQSLLQDLLPQDWFQMPQDGVTHIAWQVGHLAMAQYGLTMLRLRGKEPQDSGLLDNDFFRTFKKGSAPSTNPEAYPRAEEIRAVFDRVHQQSLQELAGYTDEELDVPLPEPHAVFRTKLGSVFFCSAHEMLHAGQIGLIRRLIGKDPLR